MTYRATSKHTRLSILHKGLIIISIPLVFELFFVFVLINLLDESSKHITAEIQSQDKIVCVETMIKELSDSTTSAVLYNVTRRQEFKDRNEKSRTRMRKMYSKLVKLCSNNHAEADAVERLNQSANMYIEQQDRAFAMSPQNSMSAFFAIPAFFQTQQFMMMRPDGAPRTILDAEEKVQTVEPKLRQQSIVRLQILILFGLAVHISITLFLVNFFARYISQRMDNVLTNTLKLGARMPLNPPLRGTDEIADLDHALHETASEILDFEKFKQQLVGMVSHELRTPLTSVQGTLTLFEAGALGPISDKATVEIEKAQASLKHLIALINNLLLLERLEAGSQVLKSEDLDIAEMIDDALEEFAKLAESKDVAIQCNVSELTMIGDWEKLLHAFYIVIETSIKRAPPNSTFSISADSESGSNVEIKISDEGPALTAVRAATYFDRNRDNDDPEIDEDERGRILFLALSKAIIEAHGGSLGVSSDESQTCFTVKLPVRKRAT